MVPWCRWFGLLLEDFFTGTAYGVRLEEELSLKRQFLDVLILRWGDGPEPESLPDGLEGLGEHNLVTSSPRQNPWTRGRWTSCSGTTSTTTSNSGSRTLMPWSQRSGSTRSAPPPAQPVPTGDGGTKKRGYVRHSLRHAPGAAGRAARHPGRPHNVPWQIFSDESRCVESGLQCYDWHQEEARSLINQFAQHYHFEGALMASRCTTLPSTSRRNTSTNCPPEVLRNALPPEERLKGLTPKKSSRGWKSKRLP